MTTYVTTIKNRKAVFTDDYIQIENLILYYNKMSNIRYKIGKSGFIFEYEGKNVLIPCEANEKDKMMPFFSKAVKLERQRKERELTLDDFAFDGSNSESGTINLTKSEPITNTHMEIPVMTIPSASKENNFSNNQSLQIPNLNNKPNSNNSHIIPFWIFILIGILFVCILIGIIGGNNNTNSIWATEITPITDFEYDIKGNYIYLTDYIGKSNKVWISARYDIDGKTYIVGDQFDNLFAFDDIDSVIIPNGIIKLDDSIFNCCEVKTLYIPSTLKNGDFCSCLYDVEKIYYGGNENEWKKLTTNESEYNFENNLKNTEIVYNSKISDLVENADLTITDISAPENAKIASYWATKTTPITDFNYSIDGDYVHLEEYTGESDTVWIGAKYEIDGKTYITDCRLGGLFALNDVYSVIIPEGVLTVENNIFNSCDVKYIYIPKSLQLVDYGYNFYDYFHDVEKVYYGGSEEDWKQLTNNKDRNEIDVVEIVYDSKITDLVENADPDQIEIPYREDIQKEIEKEKKEEEKDRQEAEEAAEELEKYAEARTAATKYFATLNWGKVFKYKYKIHYLIGLDVGEPEGGSEYGKYLAIAPTEVQNGFGAMSNGEIYLYMDEDYKLTHIFYHDADTSEEIYVSE